MKYVCDKSKECVSINFGDDKFLTFTVGYDKKGDVAFVEFYGSDKVARNPLSRSLYINFELASDGLFSAFKDLFDDNLNDFKL